MKIVYGVICWFIWPLLSYADGAIEIYAGGVKYDSVESYVTLKDTHAFKKASMASLDANGQALVIPRVQALSVPGELAQVKALDIHQQAPLSIKSRRQLTRLSMDGAVAKAMQENPQSWQSPAPYLALKLSEVKLEEAIKGAIGASQGAKLLISQAGKVRIMSLAPLEAPEHRGNP